jgi:hypothetical protein
MPKDRREADAILMTIVRRIRSRAEQSRAEQKGYVDKLEQTAQYRWCGMPSQNYMALEQRLCCAPSARREQRLPLELKRPLTTQVVSLLRRTWLHLAASFNDYLPTLVSWGLRADIRELTIRTMHVSE